MKRDIAASAFGVLIVIVAIIAPQCKNKQIAPAEKIISLVEYYDFVASDALRGYNVVQIRDEDSLLKVYKVGNPLNYAIVRLKPPKIEKNFTGSDTMTLSFLTHLSTLNVEYLYSDSTYTRFRTQIGDTIYQIFKGEPKNAMIAYGVRVKSSKELIREWRYYGHRKR